MLAAIELVEDKGTKEPAPGLGGKVVAEAAKRGLIMRQRGGADGPPASGDFALPRAAADDAGGDVGPDRADRRRVYSGGDVAGDGYFAPPPRYGGDAVAWRRHRAGIAAGEGGWSNSIIVMVFFDLVRCSTILLALSTTANAVSLPATTSDTGMVVSTRRLAAEAGVAILRQGGNAIDAAVAVGYAEAVVNPCCGNIGGGGFITAHLADGRDIFLNFREMAPVAASRDMYLDAAGQPVGGSSLHGWKAVAVPGTVMGLDLALTKYGSLPRGTVMAPAIRLAREGFELTREDAAILTRGAPLLRQDAAAARQFLRPDGAPYHSGDRLSQPELAATLQSVADQGPDAFYKGHVPQAVEAASRAGGGIIYARRISRLITSMRLPRCAAPIAATSFCRRRRHPLAA